MRPLPVNTESADYRARPAGVAAETPATAASVSADPRVLIRLARIAVLAATDLSVLVFATVPAYLLWALPVREQQPALYPRTWRHSWRCLFSAMRSPACIPDSDSVRSKRFAASPTSPRSVF